MADILASIRRIITEDAPPGGEPPRVAIPVPEADEGDDVLELGPPDVVGQAVSTPEPLAPAPSTPPASDGLLSESAQQASQRALAALSGLTIDPRAEANTLDGLVREMLRPMLKEWLDANLPEIVERVVIREVARLSGR
jgi:cell pole-organizing protein PopZ